MSDRVPKGWRAYGLIGGFLATLVVVLAVAIPLLAAIMLLFLGDDVMYVIRILAAALIFLGIAGLIVAFLVSRLLSRVVAALTGAKA